MPVSEGRNTSGRKVGDDDTLPVASKGKCGSKSQMLSTIDDGYCDNCGEGMFFLIRREVILIVLKLQKSRRKKVAASQCNTVGHVPPLGMQRSARAGLVGDSVSYSDKSMCFCFYWNLCPITLCQGLCGRPPAHPDHRILCSSSSIAARTRTCSLVEKTVASCLTTYARQIQRRADGESIRTWYLTNTSQAQTHLIRHPLQFGAKVYGRRRHRCEYGQDEPGVD